MGSVTTFTEDRLRALEDRTNRKEMARGYCHVNQTTSALNTFSDIPGCKLAFECSGAPIEFESWCLAQVSLNGAAAGTIERTEMWVYDETDTNFGQLTTFAPYLGSANPSLTTLRGRFTLFAPPVGLHQFRLRFKLAAGNPGTFTIFGGPSGAGVPIYEIGFKAEEILL